MYATSTHSPSTCTLRSALLKRVAIGACAYVSADDIQPNNGRLCTPFGRVHPGADVANADRPTARPTARQSAHMFNIKWTRGGGGGAAECNAKWQAFDTGRGWMFMPFYGTFPRRAPPMRE